MALFSISLLKYENLKEREPMGSALREFHICNDVRKAADLTGSLFSLSGNVVFADIRSARELAMKFNSLPGLTRQQYIKAGQLNAMGLVDEVLHYMVALYREQVQPRVFDTALLQLEQKLGAAGTNGMLETFCTRFPAKDVYLGKSTVDEYLASREAGESCRAVCLEEILFLALENLNPAFKPFLFLFDDSEIARQTVYPGAIEELKSYFAGLPAFGPGGMNLWDMLRAPALASPDSLLGQLEYMRKNWGLLIGRFIGRFLTGLDIIKEEEKPFFPGPGPQEAPDYGWLEHEYEAFSPDQDWMPRTVLVAKSTLVWLFQLSRKYGREITRLDEIPDEELDELSRRGFSGLWLIGLWERSQASKTIKQWTGNPEAAASAYSLYDYDIASELGGWEALTNLRDRCFRRGIRLGSDMVPNHTGIDSRWVMEHPDRFLQLGYPPFPSYTFNGGNLSNREGVGLYIEDHYYNRTDASVVFKRVDFNTGETRYIYHGNDGTSTPWNDTAQIDFLNPEAREAVIRTIIGVCKQFSIVRFDAAMTLAKRHIQRLWYPEPGRGGDIASRSEHALSSAEFNQRIPHEFWREVVDRCAVEAPHTLLLAEAFWMMEGYFVRTLGMHRVYNSSFMNMLKNEENAKYRATIKNTLEFDPEVLKRFVNFMNNPDEETAVAQFGKGDKYFGIATLLVTMPGLPMFGHGQIEGFEEKYGMEYRRSYRDEKPDPFLVDRHEREIFPLVKKRYLFSGSADFTLYDVIGTDGTINENVFAYSNRAGDEKALVFYNNGYYGASGRIRGSAVAIPQKDGTFRQDDLCTALGLHNDGRFFTVFREQRSKLWYVRSSKELFEQGLFVSLNGYEAQVFLDIHEEEDREGATAGSWDGRKAALNHALRGRGVRDLEQATLDLYLGELYSPLPEIFDKSHLALLVKGSGLPDKSPETDTETGHSEALERFKEPVMAFTRAAEKYLARDNGTYIPYEAFKTPEKALRVNHTTLWNDFASFLRRIPAAPLSPGIDEETGEDKALASLAPVVGYGLLGLLRSFSDKGSGLEAVRIASHFRLFNKLAGLWEGLGMDGNRAARAAEILRAVLSRTFPEDGEPLFDGARKSGAASALADKTAAAILLREYETPDLIRLLGVNRFDGITWFNKEAFEETLYWVPRFLLPEAPAAFGQAQPGELSEEALEARSRFIGAVVKSFRRGEEASGYKLNELLQALAGRKPSPGAGRKTSPRRKQP